MAQMGADTHRVCQAIADAGDLKSSGPVSTLQPVGGGFPQMAQMGADTGYDLRCKALAADAADGAGWLCLQCKRLAPDSLVCGALLP